MLRIGIVSYLNTAPLIWGLEKENKPWELVVGHPTELNQSLSQGNLDLALVSSYEYARNAAFYYLLPDVSISATGRVGSVLLFTNEPLEALSGKEIILTRASATSVALLKLLLEDFCGLKPYYHTGTLKEGLRAPAYLAIGDEALSLRYNSPFRESHDLAALWMEHTRLPFVFAVFAVRKEAWQNKPQEIETFAKELYFSRAKGAASLPQIANKCMGLTSLGPKECLLYLKGIEYDLSGLKQEALEVFYRHLARRKEINKCPELNFLEFS
ncbi:menaquinone biosynthetic enzyme MqnA/MqnD family protein [Thermodesulfatator atlanticus]|uniref:menaquinone biosynthetic enzyme MqnA/MqnD family protein n=1 Tax=Thermodesulfatator atlanticus TaxID=501497 RepID=UPI0003B5C7E5|nr:menaquinone biosynthesis protein [Thermodesulfatator atlanticus]